ncbi:hypothetical protein B484DRAFT_219996, partial [Ochromonadaceae sp. CCMP2298]
MNFLNAMMIRDSTSPAPVIATAVIATPDTESSSSSSSDPPPDKKKKKVGFYTDTNKKLRANAVLDATTIQQQLDVMLDLNGTITVLQAAEAARRAAFPGIAVRLHGTPPTPETMAKLRGRDWKVDLIPGHNQEFTVGSIQHLDCNITSFTQESAHLIYALEPGTITPLSIPIAEFEEILPFILWCPFIDPETKQPTTQLDGLHNAQCSLPVICRVKARGIKLVLLLPNHMGGGEMGFITKKDFLESARCLGDADLQIINHGSEAMRARFAAMTAQATNSDEEDNRSDDTHPN